MLRILIVLACSLGLTSAHASDYGKKICKSDGNICHKVKRGETWNKLFPNAEERDIVRRHNRTNVELRAGTTIAVPKNLSRISVMDIAPFPKYAPPSKTKVIRVNQQALAWGAYDTNGKLVKWGPMSGGKSWCADVRRGCGTAVGNFTVYRKQGAGCRSGKYPLPNGGAKMPYCMHFYKGYAMHGSYTVPGKHASHGCVRMFVEDAKWLNQKFIKVGSTKVMVGKR